MATASRLALWAIPVADLAGVARHALDIARVGVPGWRLDFLCPPGPLSTALREAGATVHEAPFGPTHGLLRSLRALRGAIADLGPDVLHSHLAYADLSAALAKPLRGVGLVSTEHGIARDDLVYHDHVVRSRAMSTVHAARVRRFEALVAVSQATADAMQEKWHPPQTVRVIPNGVDREESRSTAGLRFLALARLAPEKRLPELLAAFDVLRRQHPDARLTLAGSGELEQRLRDDIARRGLAGLVTMPGHVDPLAAMAGADVLVQLSVWENCSYSLLDAVNHGLGVVASPVGGNPEILPRQCLADPDDPSAVAEAMARQGLDLAARPTLGHWPTVASMAAQLGEVYDAVAGRLR